MTRDMDGPGARWNNLFDDLESQLEQELEAEDVDLRVEEERLRLGRMSLRDRLVALQARPGSESVRLVVGADRVVDVRVATIGRDWLAGEVVGGARGRIHCIVPLGALSGLLLTRPQTGESLVEHTGVEGQGLSARLGLAFVLRDLCRRRRAIDIDTLGHESGGNIGGELHGTIDRVGRDHFDMALHDSDSARRESAVTHYRVIPFERLVFVRL